MKTAGTLLIVFAAVIALAAVGDLFGPEFEARGIPFQGTVYPWAVWIPVGVAALIGGIVLRRRADAAANANAEADDDDGAGADPAARDDEAVPHRD